MENKVSIVVGCRNNVDYTQHFYETTRKLYKDVELVFVNYGSTDSTKDFLNSIQDENVVIFNSDENVSFSETYNKGMELSTRPYIMLGHNDMVLGKNFFQHLDKYLFEENIVVYTTIEPPIFPGHDRPGKILRQFGEDIQSFDYKEFLKYSELLGDLEREHTNQGTGFFMIFHRSILDTVIGFDPIFNPCFCEDDDFIRRLKNIPNINFIVAEDCIVYHFVSKTSRFSDEFQQKTKNIELCSQINYHRKWATSIDSKDKIYMSVYFHGNTFSKIDPSLVDILFENIHYDESSTNYWSYRDLILNHTKRDTNDKFIKGEECYDPFVLHIFEEPKEISLTNIISQFFDRFVIPNLSLILNNSKIMIDDNNYIQINDRTRIIRPLPQIYENRNNK